ncbi:MAG: hypothetical protein Q8Q23_01985 [bacterium]|nr:hypothetical protein [bacterium]
MFTYDGKRWQTKNRPSLTGNSFVEFERAVLLMQNAKVNFGVSTVVTKESINSLYDIHLEVFADYNVCSWAYLIAYSDNMQLSDLDVFKEQLFAIINDFPVEHLLKINDLRKWSMKISGEWPINSFCGAGTCYSALAVDGSARLCPFF